MERDLDQALEQDMTLMAAAEKQLLTARLLARLAHEIRNPLSSLDVHVQLLDEDLRELGPRFREQAAGRLAIIRGELHRLDNIVRSFLNLAGPLSCEPERLHVAEVIRHVAELLQPEAAAREVEIITRVAEGVPAVSADRTQLTQALVNLLINAIQAVGRRGRVELSAAVEPERKCLLIAVRDTGPGVPPEQQAIIFEPFFTTKPEGSGLGLWIVQQIMRAHGGTVRLVNAPDGGAIFSLRLPLLAPEATRG